MARAMTETAADLLRELVFAHQIILNALHIMTPEEKNSWGRMNARHGVDGEGTTRYHEREAVIRASSFDVAEQAIAAQHDSACRRAGTTTGEDK